MRRAAVLLLAAAVGLPLLVHAQAGRAPSDAAVTLGRTTIVNHGLDGVGRISASTIDPFGETFGSVSGLQITDWSRAADGSYTGVFNILPDRGYNGAGFLADYAARVTRVAFRFTPYTGAAPLGGGTIADEIARQRQIDMVGPMTSTRFAYVDPVSRERRTTTGLDPAGASLSLFGQPMPYVRSYMGPAAPGAAPSGPYPIEKLTIDAEALALERDGSGYIGDEYGPNIYYFDSSKTIVGAIVPPEAFRPHAPAHVLNFTSIGPPASGRRPNQGFEGVALSPDGQRLFALLQSSVVQDGDPAVNNQLSRHTRLLVYDVSVTHTPAAPIGEYVLSLPTYRQGGDDGQDDRTCAQSEIVALDRTRLLVLSRDSAGLGTATAKPTLFKRVLLVDLAIGAPTNIAGDTARNAEGGRVTTAPGQLDPAITPLVNVQAVDLIKPSDLARFNLTLDRGGDTPVSKLTLSEKWEGMTLVPALDPAAPDDYFLFVGNDNDFQTSVGQIQGPAGLVHYNAFSEHPPTRIPPPVGSPNIENDTMLLAYRITISGR